MTEIVLKGDLGRTDIFIILSFHFRKHSLNLILSDYPFTISLTDVIFVFLCHPSCFSMTIVHTSLIFLQYIQRRSLHLTLLALWIPPLQCFTYSIFIIYSLYISSCPYSRVTLYTLIFPIVIIIAIPSIFFHSSYHLMTISLYFFTKIH